VEDATTQIINFIKSKTMKRKPRFLIAIASAIITFGVLFATVGKPKYMNKLQHKMECNRSAEKK
jgi:hypothetical protein